MKSGKIIPIFIAPLVWILGKNKQRDISTTLAGAVVAFFFFVSSSCAASLDNYLTIPPQRVPPLVYKDADAIEHALSDHRGKFIVLSVWATWCPSCVYEMPQLDALQDKFDPQKLIVLPLCENANVEMAQFFYRRHGIRRLPIALDGPMRANSVLRLRGIPTTLLIDASGNEVARIEGKIDWAAPEGLGFLRRLSGNN